MGWSVPVVGLVGFRVANETGRSRGRCRLNMGRNGSALVEQSSWAARSGEEKKKRAHVFGSDGVSVDGEVSVA
jgi:hypothetical protein